MADRESRDGGSDGGRLASLLAAAGSSRAPPPAHWNPPDCGEIDLHIAADGTWLYQGTAIRRPALVKLFAAILRREGARYVLVTPVEKCGITVADAPFQAVDLAVSEAPEGATLVFRTDMDDVVTCNAAHPLRFERELAGGGLKPYVLVRDGLWARLTRALVFDLVARGEVRTVDGVERFGVASAGAFFAIAAASEIAELM